MWFALLSRFWQPLAAIALVIGAWAWAHHSGFESGYAASEAKYTPLIAAAERARDAANLKAQRQEEDSKALVQDLETQHAADVASLNLRVADAGSRIHDLSLRIATASASRCPLPEAGAPARGPDAATEVSRRAQEAGDSIISTGAGCESDAAQVIRLQQYISGVLGILNRSDTGAGGGPSAASR